MSHSEDPFPFTFFCDRCGHPFRAARPVLLCYTCANPKTYSPNLFPRWWST